MVPKLNWKFKLCLDLVRLNQTLIWPVHRGPKLNNILPKLNNVQYISLINATAGYHNIKLDERSSYLTTFACQFGRYRYKRLPFGAAPAGNMLHRKIHEILKDLPNVFGIADGFLVIWYNRGRKDQDDTLQRVLKICTQINLKGNKGKCHSNVHKFHFWQNYIKERC